MENQNVDESIKPVLAMYDVRGIQDYIFRTNKIKDAMGASSIIDNIIINALKEAVRQINEQNSECINACLVWDDFLKAKGKNPDEKKLRFLEKKNNLSIQVLFIGGGNAFVCFKNRNLYKRINMKMSKYILDTSYSLQLAAAAVDMTDDYSLDYRLVHNTMNNIKANMPDSRPLAAMPIMEIEQTTGFPLSKHVKNGENLSTEIFLKKEYKEIETREGDEKIIDNLLTQKGVESLLAVVHLDGNNMGLRIRSLMSEINDYPSAVYKMRTISYNINKAYRDTYDLMEKTIIQSAKMSPRFSTKPNSLFFRRIITAGDDITFVCNATLALSAVEFYCKEISNMQLYPCNEEEKQKMSFSVCAGIAFINGHFPFSTGYQVAEACCDIAKECAKKEENKENGNIGNWVDFQICKNIQTMNVIATRNREYVLPDGEKLMLRPYHIHTNNTAKQEDLYDFNMFKRRFHLFEKMERTVSKNLRNTYSYGKDEMTNLVSFYNSRRKDMPEGEEPFNKGVAMWYDALEMLDYYEDYLEKTDGEEK